MRIVLSNSSPKWGGLHEVTEMLARGLAARGHDIAVFVYPAGVLEERMQSITHVEPLLGGMDLSPLTIGRVVRGLKRWRADVVLMMSKKDVRVAGPAAQIYGVPYIIRYANDRPLGRLYDWLLFGRFPTGHIANSFATRETLLRSVPWLRKERVTVIYNGIDAERFERSERAATGVPDGALTFGFIGRVEKRKGIYDLAGAWPTVAGTLDTAHLIIVGKGPDSTAAKKIFGAAPRVHWLGFRNDIPALLRSIDIAVVPSHWEGFGLVALEALATGIPVIGTTASSLPEIVRDGLEGRLVPPKNPGALAATMIELANDRDARTRLGAAGYLRARQAFPLEKMLDRYEEVLLAAVKQKA